MRKAAFILACLLLVAAVGYWYSPWLLRRSGGLFGDVVFRVETSDSAIALTIDDGPDPETTPLILRTLARHDARATFFVIGRRAAEQDALTREIVARGHELGNHMMTPRRTLSLDPPELDEAMRRADSVLARYDTVRWLRPAGGVYDARLVDAAEEHGYRTVLGSVYPFDTLVPVPDLLVRFVLHGTRPGDVVILHDGRGRGRRTARILQRVLPALRERGLEVVTLSELWERRVRDDSVPP